jgi:N-methylhydantoinase A
MPIRVGIDTGGTFTDLVALDEDTGALLTAKCPSTPRQPEVAVLDTLEAAAIPPEAVRFLILGTTIATNALLTRRGARVIYLTTAGFEDVPFIQRVNRKFHYDLSWRKPVPFCARQDCLGLAERIDKDGQVRLALDEAELERVAAALAKRLDEGGERGVALAVNLLFAYVNPEHERRLGAFLQERFPDLPISLSRQVAPIWREYERGSTTLADAYIKPLIGQFAGRLHTGFAGVGLACDWAFMKSNGGNMLASAAAEQPVQLLLSGLAGGIIAGNYFGELVASRNVITLDMGGTSTDVGTITEGAYGYTTEWQIEWGVPIAAPFIDLTTIGAGGGSIAWIDRGGFLKVGPQSAGADPGPACYGRGGSNATVTDANLVLGRLDPAYFLGGSMPIEPTRAEQAVAAIGARLGQGLEETALAIVELANENMANAIRLMTVERGIDPRDYDLCAFGGAGPLHGGDLAQAVGIRRTLIPPHPGLGSALGALMADLRVDKVWTQALRASPASLPDPAMIDRVFKQIGADAMAELRREGFEGQPTLLRAVSMRYLGQNYEQDVTLPPGPIDAASLEALLEGFHRQHERFYGYRIPGETIELIHYKVSALGQVARPELPRLAEQHGPAPQPVAQRLVFFKGQGFLDCPVYRREHLLAGCELHGPAIVDEQDSTTLLSPGFGLSVSAHGILVITAS